jgi:hypothetical protein
MLLVFRLALALAATFTTFIGLQVPGDTPPVFRSSVDVVRLVASVRDQKGRFVRDLTASEFEVFDSGRMRSIKDFRPEIAGLSVALLFDVSGRWKGSSRTHVKRRRRC